jgi:hypothetical protein
MAVSSMRIPSLAKVAATPLILYGCAAHPVSFETAAPEGHIVARAGRTGIVVAAPHGTLDPGTGDVAAEISQRTGFGLVVASGFSLEVNERGVPLRRYLVNRPLEGVMGGGPAGERATEAAQRVYAEYERRVREAAHGPLVFYVEVHGNARQDTANRIEVATVGVDREQAIQLRTLLELTRDAHLRAHPETPKLHVLVEPADRIVYAAGAAKREGMLRFPERALHIELPRTARRDFRAVYAAILADFLGQAVSLRPLR